MDSPITQKTLCKMGASVVRRFVLWTLILAIMMLCGCNAWMNGSYASVTPHKEQNFLPEQTMMTPKTYEDVIQILENMVKSGQHRSTISMEKMDEDWHRYIEDVVDYVRDICPIGAYAVSDITYDISTNNGKAAISVEISYRRSIADIDAVMYAESTEEIEEILQNALKAFSVCVTVCVEDYAGYDFDQMVQDYALAYPQYVIETPQVSATMYPNDGKDRIVELVFNYDTSRASLQQMQEQVSRIFSAAETYVSGDGLPMEKFAQMYAFLMSRYNYTVQSSGTPAYSLLYHGIGDSKAFASVFSAMCSQAGLECKVISGVCSGQSWYWNEICVEDKVYYVDLLRCQEMGKFFCKTAQEMTEYDWENITH